MGHEFRSIVNAQWGHTPDGAQSQAEVLSAAVPSGGPSLGRARRPMVSRSGSTLSNCSLASDRAQFEALEENLSTLGHLDELWKPLEAEVFKVSGSLDSPSKDCSTEEACSEDSTMGNNSPFEDDCMEDTL